MKQLIACRQLTSGVGDLPNPALNMRWLKRAYIALSSMEESYLLLILQTFTSNWEGANTSRAPSRGAGFLADVLVLFTLNCILRNHPQKALQNLKLLDEIDFSNNRFVGPFPKVVLELPKLKFLDLRYNEFEGSVPSELFDKNLDAIFLNNNRFAPPSLQILAIPMPQWWYWLTINFTIVVKINVDLTVKDQRQRTQTLYATQENPSTPKPPKINPPKPITSPESNPPLIHSPPPPVPSSNSKPPPVASPTPPVPSPKPKSPPVHSPPPPVPSPKSNPPPVHLPTTTNTISFLQTLLPSSI
ncbi:hypothetical protein HAX54_037357 [Datura stramonium]|uniref:Uncharacterized protein n=1 Tax=Datura stramonium TaxID=4076 RepID=A0ABS8RMX5_DATST|nr:hypothetical protein [Datura stramonium]